MRWALLLIGLVVGVSYGQDTTDLKKIAADLKSKDVKIRLKALEDAEKKGRRAQPLARLLFDALLDKQTSKAALLAIESVRPDLYEPTHTLMTSGDPARRRRALADLAGHGTKASPASGLFVATIQTGQTKQGGKITFDDDAKAAIGLLGSIATLDDTVVVKLVEELARNQEVGVNRIRLVGCIVRMAGEMPTVAEGHVKRVEVAGIIKVWLTDPDMVLPAIHTAGELGKAATDLAPAIRELKLSTDAKIREAATAAYKLIVPQPF